MAGVVADMYSFHVFGSLSMKLLPHYPITAYVRLEVAEETNVYIDAHKMFLQSNTALSMLCSYLLDGVLHYCFTRKHSKLCFGIDQVQYSIDVRR